MDTKKYEVFEKTVELSSLTKAAEELGLTQSGVSHIIAALEEEFGFPLLTRSRTGAGHSPLAGAARPDGGGAARPFGGHGAHCDVHERGGALAAGHDAGISDALPARGVQALQRRLSRCRPLADGRERGHRVHHAADGAAVRMHSPAGGSASRHTAGEPSAGKEGRLPGKRGCGAAVHLAARVLGRRRAPRA